MVYNKQKGQYTISLEEHAIELLKTRVEEISPELVNKIENKRNAHKAMKRLKNDIAKGLIGSKRSKFKPLGPKKS